ncbi:ATPase, partial [Thermococci archaeon]
MAEKGIREYDAKRLMAKALPEFSGGKLIYEAKSVLIGPETDINKLADENPWLKTEKLVAKPDQLFGKRGKNNLLYVNKTWDEVKTWIKERMNRKITIIQTTGKTTGVLTHFLVEQFVPHEDEYYVAITTHRDKDTIHFSMKGGVDIEEVWDTVV